MDEEQKEALGFVLRQAIKLGSVLGSWLDSDMKFCHHAANDALKAMTPHFVSEIETRFREIERKKSGLCQLCGKKRED
ncbi:hypothetical protein LCGC14_0376160 [marine sediment metagenome]|uniref:Uncharacterized protein n=1 Tax=marine sediment metagenome TaxID=412755 RepID=A0A0F9WCJ3_9ZZZZ